MDLTQKSLYNRGAGGTVGARDYREFGSGHAKLMCTSMELFQDAGRSTMSLCQGGRRVLTNISNNGERKGVVLGTPPPGVQKIDSDHVNKADA